MKSMVQNPKNWRLLSAFGGLLLMLALVLVACGSTQTGSSTPTPAHFTPGTTVYTFKGHSGRIGKVAWSPDGKYITSEADQNIRVWEAMTGKLIRSFNMGNNSNADIALSPDGKYVAAGFADHTVKVLDIMTGNTLLTHMGDIGTIGWSPDGKYIATGNDLTMQVWDAKTGKTSLTYKVPPKTEADTMFGLLWSPDSKYIAVGGTTKTVIVLDAMTGKVISTYSGHTEVGAGAIAWSPDGKYIISVSWDLTNQVWDAITGKHIHTFQGGSFVAAWSPDGKYLALGGIFKLGEQAIDNDSNAHVLDASTWNILLTYTGHMKTFVKDDVVYPQSVTAIAWSPDGKYIASGSDDKTVRVWIAP
jgi:WD40 repeat protein